MEIKHIIRKSWLVRYQIAFISVGVASLLRLWLIPLMNTTGSFSLFFLAILFTSAISGFWPGTLASILSTLSGNVLSQAPFFTPGVENTAELADLIEFLLSGIVASWLVSSFALSNRKISNILSSIHEGFFLIDKNWQFVHVSVTGAHLLGETDYKKMLGKKIWQYFGKENGKFISFLEPVAQKEQSANFRFFYRRSRKWFEAAAYPSDQGISLFLWDVTDRLLVQKGREETLTLLNAVLDTAPIGIAFFDTNLRYRRVNKILADLNNLDAADHIGKTLQEVVPRLAPQLKRKLTRVIATGKPQLNVELSSPSRNDPGKMKFWLESYYPIGNDKKIIGVGAVVQDITEQKKAAEKIETSEQQMRQLLQSTDEGIYGLDLQGKCTFINSSGARILGYKASELVGKDMHDKVHHSYPDGGKYPAKKCSIYQSFRQGKGNRRDDEVYWRKDGTSFPAEYSSHPIILGGKIQGAVVAFIDITARKKAEEQIRETEAKFKALYDSNIIGLFTSDKDGRVTSANEAFLLMIGYKKDQVDDGKLSWQKLTPHDEIEKVERKVKILFKKGSVAPFEREYLRSDGSRVPAMVAAVVLNAKEKTHLTFVLDITEKKKLEQRKDDFISLASHELKTPITSAKAYGQYMEKVFQKNKDYKSVSLVRKMNQQFDRLTKLVLDLLDVSKIDSGRMEYSPRLVAIDNLVAETVKEIQSVNGENEFILSGRTKTKTVADRERIKQVMINLLNNAIKYSRKGSKVVVHLANSNKHLRVGVQDFGIGIPPSKQKRIFERFYQVSSTKLHTYSGLGIGLTISAEIIKRHQGKIWVESREGKGSTFYFTLPIKQ